MLTIITGGVEECGSSQTQLHILVALALGICNGQVRLIVSIRRRNNAGGSVIATVLVLVATGLLIRVCAILTGDISTVIGAVRGINCIEEVVERCALLVITSLEEGNLLGVRQGLYTTG